ncbi:MAG TPA: hypothetical protein VMT03_20105 [Polyangia bacterium]|nr:hypothetical protein [Polyangia bacterium]
MHVASVTPEGMSDGDIDLRRSPGRLSGHVGVEPIQLRLEPRRAAGTLGDHPVDLDVARSGDGLQVAGTFGVQSVAKEIRHEGIEAQIGPCTYRLPFTMGRYRGSVACGGSRLGWS